MDKLRFLLYFLVMVLVVFFALSCGSGQSQLQSITVSPATADGQAQFIATGHYVNPSRTVTPQSANWAACQGNVPTTEVSVTTGTTGSVAQCSSGATGSYTIRAWDNLTGPGTYNCPTQTACSGGCTVAGTAQLTCP
jgi:hypothetical protein